MRSVAALVSAGFAAVLVACGGARGPKQGTQEPRASGEPAQGSEEAWSAERPFHAPEVIERRLESGIRFLGIERRDFPLVRIGFVLKRGATDAPTGVASYAASLLPGETRKLQHVLYNVRVQSWASDDAFGIDARGTTQAGFWGSNLPDDTFVAIADLLKQSRITQDDVNLERSNRLAPGAQGSADYEIARLERAALYPGEHPYHWLASGDAQAAGSIGPAEISRFFEENVKPDQLSVTAVGDFARESLIDSIRNGFRSWRGRAQPRRPLPEPIQAPLDSAVITLVDAPGLTQSRLLVAARGAPGDGEDYRALYLAHAILGGSPLSSRLYLNLRERNGYTYMAFSSFGSWRGSGPFEVWGAIARESTADAIHEIETEIERLGTAELEDDEVERAKAAVIRRFPNTFATLSSTLGALNHLAIYDRPADFFLDEPKRFAAVSPEDVRRAARKYLARDKLRWFVSTDAASVRGSLERLGLGPVRVIEREREPPAAKTGKGR